MLSSFKRVPPGPPREDFLLLEAVRTRAPITNSGLIVTWWYVFHLFMVNSKLFMRCCNSNLYIVDWLQVFKEKCREKKIFKLFWVCYCLKMTFFCKKSLFFPLLASTQIFFLFWVFDKQTYYENCSVVKAAIGRNNRSISSLLSSWTKKVLKRSRSIEWTVGKFVEFLTWQWSITFVSDAAGLKRTIDDQWNAGMRLMQLGCRLSPFWLHCRWAI